MSRGSLTDPLACALFEQETVVRAPIEALFEFIVENTIWIRNRRKLLQETKRIAEHR